MNITTFYLFNNTGFGLFCFFGWQILAFFYSGKIIYNNNNKCSFWLSDWGHLYRVYCLQSKCTHAFRNSMFILQRLSWSVIYAEERRRSGTFSRHIPNTLLILHEPDTVLYGVPKSKEEKNIASWMTDFQGSMRF